MPSNNTSPMFFYYTYVFLSRKDGKHYIGYTIDLRKRLEKHRQGKVFATKTRLAMDLIYYEACRDKFDAKQREKYLKTTPGRQFLAKRLSHFNANHVWHQVK